MAEAVSIRGEVSSVIVLLDGKGIHVKQTKMIA
jgi:hypothetical protein